MTNIRYEQLMTHHRDLVQFEEDCNVRPKCGGGGAIGYLRQDQFLDHLTVIKSSRFEDFMDSAPYGVSIYPSYKIKE